MTKYFWLCGNDKETAIVESAEHPKTRYDGGPWSRTSIRYASLEALKEGEGLQPCCAKCGKMYDTKYIEPTKSEMLAANHCFYCNFWSAHAKQKNHPQVARVRGTHYWVNKSKPVGYQGSMGHGGRKFKVRWNDGREMESNDVWCQGDIPDVWREELPDNAEFLA